MRNFLKAHRVAIFLAVVVGIITGLPTILAPLAINGAYHGIPFLPLNDEYHYLANIHEVLDGHVMNASTFLYEYKNLLPTTYPVNEWFYAIPALVFGITTVVTASKFILPALLFFLVYILVRSIFGKGENSELTAIAIGLFVTLGAAFVNYADMYRIIVGVKIPEESLWTRLVNPIMGALQLTGFLILLWKLWSREWRYAYIAAGVLLATTVGYFFTFCLSLAILGTLFLIALARREYDIVKNLFFVGGISIILDSPWWYAMFTTLQGDAGRLIATESGMTFTHAPVLNKALLAATFILVSFFSYTYFYLRDRQRIREWLFIASLIIGSWIAFNQQVVTGREVWYPHFVQYTVPLCMIAVIATAYLALQRYKFAWKVAMYTLCLITISYGLFSTTSYTEQSDLHYYTDMQSYAPAFSWLNENAPRDCVVLVSDDTYRQEGELLIPALTHCNTYTVWDSLLAMTQERKLHDFLLIMQMRGIKPAEAESYLTTNWGDVRGSFYETYDQAFGHGVDPWVKGRIEYLKKEYSTFAKTDIETHIKEYRVDYLLSEGPLSPVLKKALPDISFVINADGYYLYSFPSAR